MEHGFCSRSNKYAAAWDLANTLQLLNFLKSLMCGVDNGH